MHSKTHRCRKSRSRSHKSHRRSRKSHRRSHTKKHHNRRSHTKKHHNRRSHTKKHHKRRSHTKKHHKTHRKRSSYYKKSGGDRDSVLRRAGVSGYNRPKRTPSHPTKSHIVVAKEGNRIKTIRFGQQGVRGSPKRKGESEYHRKRRNSFRARHARNIAKGKMSAAYWANKVKW